MAYVRETYGVPAKRGRLVEVYYRAGGAWTLAARARISSASNHLHLRGGIGPFHPTHNVVYFDDDGETVLLDTRKL